MRYGGLPASMLIGRDGVVRWTHVGVIREDTPGFNEALREVLGTHVQQKGSLVDPDKTRFDFAHTAPMSAEEIREVEEIVNREILANTDTRAELMALEAAQKTGAMMLFGEKYGDEVRVLSIGSTRELCGGTHVARTGDIGLFKIVSEGGVAAGIRRVEAITGENALRYAQEQERRVQGMSALLKVQPDEVAERVAGILDNVRALEKELANPALYANADVSWQGADFWQKWLQRQPAAASGNRAADLSPLYPT